MWTDMPLWFVFLLLFFKILTWGRGGERKREGGGERLVAASHTFQDQNEPRNIFLVHERKLQPTEPPSQSFHWDLKKKDFIFIYFYRGGREGERKGEKHSCPRETLIHCLSQAPNLGPGGQPRHVPWPRIKQVTSVLQDEDQPSEPHQPGLSLWFWFAFL